MKYKRALGLFYLSIFLLTACNTLEPFYGRTYEDWESSSLPTDARIQHTVYLMGDAGEEDENPIYNLVSRMLKEEPDSASSIIWMGDNIYYDGLPEPDESDRAEKEEVILRQMRVSDTAFTGNVIFIPGNHDWNASHEGGLEAVRRQEQFVEEYFNGRDVFLPSNGCAGPVVVPVNDSLVFIVVDTEWWSHKHAKARYPDAGCTVEDRVDLVVQLEDAIRSNQNKNILILGHHPIESNGNHGGHYNLLDNIFPLRLVRDNLYLPLPLIGSIYPLLRKLGVSPQDIPSLDGQQWKDAILSMAQHRPNVIYAAGHDHNIQMHKMGMMHEIISGSAAKTTFAAEGFGAAYVHQRSGFARLLYYDNGQVWVEYFIADKDTPEGELSFRNHLYTYKPQEIEPPDFKNVPDYRDSIITLAANPDYQLSKFGQFLMGSHYRKEWVTPVTIPYIDIKSFSGGLEPIKKVGGKQTLSLLLRNEDSVQFILRSIDKFPATAISEQFRFTWLNDLIQDQITTAHPYGAFTIPKMADVTDIYYTRPALVYTPYTPYLEQYRNQFGGMMSMIEVQPNEDLSSFARFGNSENVVSSQTMFRHLREDNDNEIDQRLFLKSRLFDMILGDWDRHENQWRWAEYKKEKGSIFKPIPRDRDQVYSKYDGVLPWLLSRKWAFRNLVSFDYEIEDVKSLNMVAQNMDRMLLSGLTREDWRHIAIQLKYQLSDYAIESAIRDMPPEVFKFSGEEIIAKLKARRDKVVETALDYYDFLTKEVYIVTSNDHERFEIKRYKSDSTIVSIYKTKEKGDIIRPLYERIFYTGKTKEIRIFSRGGEDRFFVIGDSDDAIRVKIVGGAGEDYFGVSSTVFGSGRSVWIYDNESGNTFNVNEDTKLTLSEETWVNDFTRNLYQYDYLGPILSLESNVDEGLLWGVGMQYNNYGFRTDPMKMSHFFKASYASRTKALRFEYIGTFYNFFHHRWDLQLKSDYLGPNSVFNYFGFGNESVFDEERGIDYYRVGLKAFRFEPSIVHRFSGAWTLGLGTFYSSYNIKEDRENILQASGGEDFMSTRQRDFIGAKFTSEVKLADQGNNPEKGMRWYNEARYNYELSQGNRSYASLSSDLSFYFTPNLPVRATFAVRLGGGANLGDFYFYQSRFLDGFVHIRGYRRTRFAGRSNFYNNSEVRIKILDIRTHLLTGDIGAIAFHDIGRVWTQEPVDFTNWHNSYGPGLYFNFYNLFIVSTTYAISDEGRFFNFRLGYLF
jgi:hypothetical protein